MGKKAKISKALAADAKKLKAMGSALKSQHGEAGLMLASHSALIPRIPVGVWDLDKSLGGGLPIGKISLIKGWEHAGKTTIFLLAAAQAQQMCGNCFRRAELHPGREIKFDPRTGEVTEVETLIVTQCECGKPRSMRIAFVDVEGSLDMGWAEALGVIPERMWLSLPIHAEETVDLVSVLLESDLVDVVILDSIAAMSPSIELEQSAVKSFEQNPGLHARIMGSAYRKWRPALSVARRNRIHDPSIRLPSLWTTNQIRYKIGVKFGNPETTPGGNAPQFYSSVALMMRKGKVSVSKDKDAKLLETYWAELRWKIDKIKVANSLGQSGTLRLCEMDAGPHTVGDVLDHETVLYNAIRYGIVERPLDKNGDPGSNYLFLGQKVNGKANLIDRWSIERDLYQQVKDLTMQQARSGGSRDQFPEPPPDEDAAE